MKMSGNTILITGGGSGIGLALAEQFAKLKNDVIIAGRSEAKLLRAAKENRQLNYVVGDVSNYRDVHTLADEAIRKFPNLNVVIHSAGIMRNEMLLNENVHRAENDETIATNLLGTIRLTEALLPHFKKQRQATIMTVTSGLAFVPLAVTPTYCATKAAIHSYTQSLRYQLKETAIEVIELVPPYVATHLMGERQAKDPFAMPLNEFIDEVTQILKDNPHAKEILVKRVQAQRFAGLTAPDQYDEFFTQFNDRMIAARRAELGL